MRWLDDIADSMEQWRCSVQYDNAEDVEYEDITDDYEEDKRMVGRT